MSSNVELFENEVISIAEMITDAQFHSIIWTEFFEDQIEEIKQKVKGNEDQFIQEFFEYTKCTEGWAIEEVREVISVITGKSMSLVLEDA